MEDVRRPQQAQGALQRSRSGGAQYGEGQCWTREIEEFFSKTDKEKYPEAQEYRFEKI